MRVFFIITTSLIGVFIAYGYPFIAMLRGNRLWPTLGIGWALLFLYFLTLCSLLPFSVIAFDREFGAEMMRNWVPEMPGAMAVAVMGWFPVLMGAALGMSAKLVLNRFWPATAQRFLRKSRHEVKPSL
jgi:hypothetical protein